MQQQHRTRQLGQATAKATGDLHSGKWAAKQSEWASGSGSGDLHNAKTKQVLVECVSAWRAKKVKVQCSAV